MLIFLAAFALSCIYQLSQVLEQRSLLVSRYSAEAVNLPRAEEARDRLVGLVNDLIATSAKDPNAALIVQEAKQAGILHDKSSSTNSAPSNP